MPDCGFCHTGVAPAPSLAQLLPGARVNVSMEMSATGVTGSAAAAAGEDVAAWQRALVSALADEGVHVPGHGVAAPELVVSVRRIEGPGSTDAGATFVAVRYDAVLRVRRATVTVRGAPFVSTREPRREEARAELIRRIVPIIVY